MKLVLCSSGNRFCLSRGRGPLGLFFFLMCSSIVYQPIINFVFDIFINTGLDGGFTPQKLLKLIRTEKVPSILGLVAITGLPRSDSQRC